MADVFYPMQWIADKVTYDLLEIQAGTGLADSLNFIIYDILKIFTLLCVMIFLIAYMRSYITPERSRRILGGKKGPQYNVGASLVGTVTPFCSCSSVPIFIGFIEAGVPLGVTFSFLITSPLVNEAAIAVLWATLGFKATALYVISGVLIGVIGGYAIGFFKLEKYVEGFVYNVHSLPFEEAKMNSRQRLDYAFDEVKSIVGKVWIYVVIGVSIGGLFHGFAPEGILAEYAGKDNLLAVPIAVLIGVPLYSNVMGLIPVVESLIGKGLPIGTSMAFLMSVTAVSLPEMIILKKVLKNELIAVFVGIVTIAVIFTGYMFNIVL